MIPTHDPLQLPTPPAEPAPAPFPLVASVAPLTASLVIWLVTGSAFVLLFAALGPIIAVATVFDGRRVRGAARRRDAARYARELATLRAAVQTRHDQHRAEAWRHTPSAANILGGGADESRWNGDRSTGVVLGSGPIPSDVRLETRHRSDEEAELGVLAATVTDAPVVVDLAGGLGIVGPLLLRRAMARGLLIQLAHAIPPNQLLITASAPGWDWLGSLPHANARSPARKMVVLEAGRADLDGADAGPQPGVAEAAAPRLTLVLADDHDQLPPGCACVVRVHGAQQADIVRSPGHDAGLRVLPELISEREARRFASSLDHRARLTGLITPQQTLPNSVMLGQLRQFWRPGPSSDGASLACVIGLSARGPVTVDLVGDGPHAVVGGTTGSGKSELLVSWVAALAAVYSPAQVTFLLVDFKGGAAFTPLLPLPHCVGLITDLDEREAGRALTSLRAEIRYREQQLQAAGARDIADRHGIGLLPRLVIVVDEFQAMLASFAELHALFIDLAARGRSLGIHLILCTQRPSGVVRDALLANCSLRLSLRVNNRADSQAVIGTDAAATLPASKPGRCVVGRSDGDPQLCQIAVTSAADIGDIVASTPSTPPPRRPWRARLPGRLTPAELAVALGESRGRHAAAAADHAPADGVKGAYVLGLLDDPEQQRYRVARYDPATDGHLLVVGGAGAGKSSLLAMLAGQTRGPATEAGGDAAADGGALLRRVVAVTPAVDTVWDALAGPHEPGTLLLFDDFDSVHARWEPDYQAVALERLSGILRDGHSAGVHVAVAVQRLTAALHPVQALFQSTLVMGLPDRQEHRAAGGADALFEPALPPGGGTWKGLRIQLLTEWPSVSPSGAGSGEAHRHPREPVPALEPANNHPLLVVSGAPTRTAALLRSAIRRPGTVIELSGTATGTGAGAAGRIELTDATGGTIFVGDPDSWQAHWPLLTALRSRADLVFDRCSLSEYRLISRRRDLPPVLVPGGSQVWVLRPDGEVTRATLPV